MRQAAADLSHQQLEEPSCVCEEPTEPQKSCDTPSDCHTISTSALVALVHRHTDHSHSQTQASEAALGG